MAELLSWLLPEDPNYGCVLLMQGEVSSGHITETKIVFRDGCGYLEGADFLVYLPREVLLWLTSNTARVAVCASILSGGVAGFCGYLPFAREDYLKILGAYEYC